MKPKSLCFTGEADRLVYPDYRYRSLLRPALVTGEKVELFTNSGGEGAAERAGSVSYMDEIFYLALRL